ncbi:MAG TPA: hypothetical protein VK453_27455 [Micromonosporaceae bacterium]|nr:hypothetical protein [Micromonosporaceae bacterium]
MPTEPPTQSHQLLPARPAAKPTGARATVSEQSRHGTGARTRPAVGGRPDAVLQLQRDAGNRAVAATATGPGAPSATAGPTDAAPTVVWTAPADASPSGRPVSCHTGPEAAAVLRFLAARLRETGDSLDEAGTSALAGMAAQVEAEAQRYAETTLEPRDPGLLNGYVSLARSLAQQEVEAAITRSLPALALPDGDLAALEHALEQLAEQSHQAFIAASPDALAQVLTAIDKANALVGAVKEYAGKVQQVTDLLSGVRAVKTLGDLAKRVGGVAGSIAEQIASARKIIGVVHDVAVLGGITGTANGTAMMSGIRQFQAGIALVDKSIGRFGAAVPLFGDLWSKIYRPMIDACIKGLKVLAKADERRGRMVELAGLLMMGAGDGAVIRDANGAPVLSPGAVAGNYFPGGQPVFSYVYAVRQGGRPPLPAAVRDFFLDRTDLFNVREAENEQLSSGEWEIFSPSTWSRSGRRDNVSTWVSQHIDKVWGMLYGDLGRYLP